MRCILVGTDFSEGSARALARARELADRMATPVTVLHVSADPRWEPEGPSRQWLARNRVDDASLVIRSGLAWAQMIRTAGEMGAGLVVVGSHGERGCHPLGPGSTTASLLGRCPVPVVVVSAGGGD